MEIGKKITPKDFPNICRACLTYGDVQPLSHYLWILESIINLKEIILSENLPQNLCASCIRLLEDVCTFSKTFKENDIYLRGLSKLDVAETAFSEHDDTQNSDDGHTTDSVDEGTIKVEEGTEKVEENNVKKKRIEHCSCNICDSKFTRLGGLKRHMKIHMGIKPFQCKVCKKTFVEKATLQRHSLIHTGEKPFECNLCGKSSRRKNQIVEHIKKQHPNATNLSILITEYDRKDSSYQDVENITTDTPQKDDDDSVNGEQENEVRKFKTKKRIEICLCNLCGKVFRRRGYLKNHMAIHAKVKPFECNICGKSFTQRHVLTRHNLVHTKERPFQCNLCGKTFTRKEVLTEHIKNHDDNKCHLCFHCGKRFGSKDYLSRHLKYYLTGHKKDPDDKCVCPYCGKVLHSASYLKTHLLTHTGEKPFECNICGQRFTVQQTLKHHLNIHKGIKPFQCTECDKRFRTSNSLKKHGLLHSGEKPFKCTSCDKAFIRRNSLKRHFRTHVLL